MAVFQFTIDLEDWNALKTWLAHFERTGMAAGMVENEDGLCSVWRAGRRMGGVNGTTVDAPRGILRQHVHGFDRLWKAGGGKMALRDDVRRLGWEKQE